MDHFETAAVLKTFEVIVDTREQDTPRARQRYNAFGVPFRRGTLAYGDYCGNVILPNGRSLLDLSETLHPLCAVERKMNLDELAGCFTRSRKRFEREFLRAKENGARIFLLCEDGNLEKVAAGHYRSKFHPTAFMASIIAWAIRYDLQLLFCSQLTSGMIIKEILYRDIKERLERGDYDAEI